MKNVLERLQPLREARERRAQRQHHEDSQAHRQALALQLSAQRSLRALETSQRDTRQAAMGDAAVTAAQAQAALAYAGVLAVRAGAAQSLLTTRSQAAAQALAAARASQQAHARLVRINDMVGQVCDRLAAEQRRATDGTAESRSDDEFSAGWAAQRPNELAGGRA